MTSLRALDLHAHIETEIPATDLLDLDALVFAATRTLDEAEVALRRDDAWTIWGVGCHPGLVGAQRSFDLPRFESLMKQTAYVSEVGLDGSSRVPMERQKETLKRILGVLQRRPRIVSLHSYAATEEVLAVLETTPIRGAVLHWWLSEPSHTQRALELGCYFSVNVSSVRRQDILDLIPKDRILPETDHPFGDRRGGASRRPGNVTNVEQTLAAHYGIDEKSMRVQLWRNLRDLVSETRTGPLLQRAARITLASI